MTTAAPTWTSLERSRTEIGDLLEEHQGGLLPGAPELKQFSDDPVDFDRWSGREPVDYQIEIMESVVSERYTGVKGAQGVGKDRLLGSLAVWAAYCRKMLVLVISATERQVRNQSMKEVHTSWRDHQRAGHELQGEAFRGALRIGGEDRIIGITGGATADAIQGFHDENGVLVLVSESQSEALERSVYETFDAVTTNERSRVMVLGNPIRPHGGFFELFQRKSWRRFTVSAFDTPNVREGRVVHPSFPYPKWPADMAREHGGESSPWYRARVLGEFPMESESALISRESWDRADDLERASTELNDLCRLHKSGEAPPAVVAVDVAREGKDKTAVCVRWGCVLYELSRWREPDTVENSKRIVDLVNRLINENKIPIGTVIVDETSMGGGVYDLLQRLLQDVGWYQVVLGYNPHLCWGPVSPIGFKASRKAPSSSRFVDTRSQSYWHLRDQFESGSVVLNPQVDQELLRDLREEVLAHDYRHEGDDRLRILPKDQVRARIGGRSPDLGDSLSMSYALDLRSDKKRIVADFR